jgi:Cu/Ag efflux pump CusA
MRPSSSSASRCLSTVKQNSSDIKGVVQSRVTARAEIELTLHAALAMAAFVGLLEIALPQPRLVALLLVNAPLALVGGIAAVWIAGLTVSLGAANCFDIDAIIIPEASCCYCRLG